MEPSRNERRQGKPGNKVNKGGRESFRRRLLELTRTRLSKDETMTRDEEGRGHEDGQNHPKMRRNRRRPTKPFIGIPRETKEKTEGD